MVPCSVIVTYCYLLLVFCNGNLFHCFICLKVLIRFLVKLFSINKLIAALPSCSSFLPVGVMFMTASYVVEVGDDFETVFKLGKFTAVVICGYVMLVWFFRYAVFFHCYSYLVIVNSIYCCQWFCFYHQH